jgi:hypothetical protein
MGKFENQVNKFDRKADAKFRAIGQWAVQDTISMAQKTIGEGGRMRIDTGFLRASIQASLHTMPRGPNSNEGDHKYPIGSQVTGQNISTVLLQWDPNKRTPLFVGWTANYARIRESKDGYLRGAVEKWDQTVFKAVKIAEVRFG